MLIKIIIIIGIDVCNTVEPVYYGHLGTNQKYPDYRGVLIFQVNLHNKESFGIIARCVDYAWVHIFRCPDLRGQLSPHLASQSNMRLR